MSEEEEQICTTSAQYWLTNYPAQVGLIIKKPKIFVYFREISIQNMSYCYGRLSKSRQAKNPPDILIALLIECTLNSAQSCKYYK